MICDAKTSCAWKWYGFQHSAFCRAVRCTFRTMEESLGKSKPRWQVISNACLAYVISQRAPTVWDISTYWLLRLPENRDRKAPLGGLLLCTSQVVQDKIFLCPMAQRGWDSHISSFRVRSSVADITSHLWRIMICALEPRKRHSLLPAPVSSAVTMHIFLSSLIFPVFPANDTTLYICILFQPVKQEVDVSWTDRATSQSLVLPCRKFRGRASLWFTMTRYSKLRAVAWVS